MKLAYKCFEQYTFQPYSPEILTVTWNLQGFLSGTDRGLCNDRLIHHGAIGIMSLRFEVQFVSIGNQNRPAQLRGTAPTRRRISEESQAEQIRKTEEIPG